MQRLLSIVGFSIMFIVAISLGHMTAGCGGKTPTPAQVADAIITCTETICTTSPSNAACTQLEGAVMGCLTSGGNVAICLAGIPSLVSVGYADVACIVAALATPAAGSKYTALATPEVQKQAADWLASQRIVVNLK
jgi:hypothetical protein